MRELRKYPIRVCDNEKGQIWLEGKPTPGPKWDRINDKEINPDWFKYTKKVT